MSTSSEIKLAARMILEAGRRVAFTGAGISVESGIPPFRGPEGLWSKYNPEFLDIDFFYRHPSESWKLIKEIFYDFFGKAKPNAAHYALAELEKSGLLDAVITQNIDNLHQEAGSKNVYEFHGNSRRLICTECKTPLPVAEASLDTLPPRCPKCHGILKPDFIFFGEAIPEPANSLSFAEAEKADLFILIGTTGEIMPASMIPDLAKQAGAKIIEVNIEPSAYTRRITDLFIREKATQALSDLLTEVKKEIS
jgi:NAD-dependent deacetylase